jgi:hypothetical protein
MALRRYKSGGVVASVNTDAARSEATAEPLEKLPEGAPVEPPAAAAPEPVQHRPSPLADAHRNMLGVEDLQRAALVQHLQPQRVGPSAAEQAWMAEHNVTEKDFPLLHGAFERARQNGIERDSPEMFHALGNALAAAIPVGPKSDSGRSATGTVLPAETPPPALTAAASLGDMLPPAPKGPPVSAPVSREVRSIGGSRSISPSQIRLSAEEREVAKLSNISEVEYAQNKLRLAQAKADGRYAKRGR